MAKLSNEHRHYYLLEITADLQWYGSVYSDIKNHFHMSGRTPEEVVTALIEEYHLAEKK